MFEEASRKRIEKELDKIFERFDRALAEYKRKHGWKEKASDEKK